MTADLVELVRILEEEGFGALAGMILSEISLGREPLAKSPDDTVEALIREPITDDEQIGEFVRLLQQHLVEPALALAKAEEIAGQIVERAAVSIRFTAPSSDGRVRDELRKAGDREAAVRLATALHMLETAAATDKTSGTP